MENSNVINAQLLNTTQAAKYLGISPGTLNNWRYRGEGPSPTKLGRYVRYHIRELEKYIARSTQKFA